MKAAELTDRAKLKPLKAYRVSCQNGDHGQSIEFAHRGKDVGRHLEACDCPYIEIRVKREPNFDKYAPGPMTTEQLLAEGWQSICGGCGGYVYAGPETIVIGGTAYCCIHCVRNVRNYTGEPNPDEHESITKWRQETDQFLAAYQEMGKS